jgi:hypothetical protein
MGGMTSLVSNIGLLEKGIGLVTNLAGGEIGASEDRAAQDQALRNLQRQQTENMRQMQEDASLSRQQLSLQTESAERERRNALRRAVSRQRANFGAQGVGGGGSAQAVLLGLFDESDGERAERERLDSVRLNAIDLGLDQQSRLNLIQREQLRETQRLNNLSSRFSRTTNALDFGLGLLKY